MKNTIKPAVLCLLAVCAAARARDTPELVARDDDALEAAVEIEKAIQ